MSYQESWEERKAREFAEGCERLRNETDYEGNPRYEETRNGYFESRGVSSDWYWDGSKWNRTM